jgi:serine/threonine protein kinase
LIYCLIPSKRFNLQVERSNKTLTGCYMTNLEGAILSDYFLLQCISAGGVADVYRARQNGEGNHEVAVKIFRSGYAHPENFRDYFMAEAEKIGQFEHPHILPLLEFGEGEDLLYVVMPYVATGTLEDLLKRVGGRLSALQALPIMQQLCGAVQYAHSLGSIHGNLKPSNVFVAADGRILLADFGIARDYDDHQQSLTRMGWGSAEYAAPEQSLGVLKRSSDIYSLGVLLFRILAGQPPFSGQTPVEVMLKHVRQAPPPIRTIVPDISDAVDGVLQMALQKQGDNRFASAEELGNAFFAAITVAPVASRVARPMSVMPPPTTLAHLSEVVEPRTPVPVGNARNMSNLDMSDSGIASNASGKEHRYDITSPPERVAVPTSVGPRTPVPQPAYFEPGIAVGRQHFWSAEPVEWSPLSSLQGTNTLKDDVPLNAGDYLQDKAGVMPTRSATSFLPQPQSAEPVVPLDPPVSAAIAASHSPASPSLTEHVSDEEVEGAESAEGAFAARLHKLLPLIVVLLLLLGLLGAFLSSFFFPSGASGTGVVPLHSVLGTMAFKVANFRDIGL